MQYYFSEKLFHINPNHDTVYLIGSGVSVDLFWDSDESINLDREKSIIIAVNAAITLVRPTAIISGDPWAFPDFMASPNYDDTVLWIGRPVREEWEENPYPHPYICGDELVSREYRGSGLEAFYIAYYLHKNYNIGKIYYTGFDMSHIIIQAESKKTPSLDRLPPRAKKHIGKMIDQYEFRYASCLTFSEIGSAIQAPKRWYADYDYDIVKTYNHCYLGQLAGLSELHYDEDFSKKLQCRSLMNISYLDDRSATHGYERAFEKSYYIDYLMK